MRALIHLPHESYLPQHLRADGWIVDIAEPSDDLALWTDLSEYDCIITSGAAALKALRLHGCAQPVVILADMDTANRVAAFTAGADAIIGSPYHRDEIVAVAAAVGRRARGVGTPVIKVGPMAVDLNSHSLHIDGKRVHLTGKEQMILETLVTRPRTQTKGDLMNALYDQGGDEPEQKIVDVFVCKLRKKLREAGGGDPIATVWGRGYVFRGYEPAESTVEKAA